MSNSLKRYEIVGPLGSGSFGNVYGAIDRTTNKPVAIKVIKNHRDDSEREGVRNIRRAGPNPNILAFVEEVAGSREAMFVFEYAEGGDLYHGLKRLGSYSEADVRDIVRGTALGLLHLHKHKIIHRDAKPENILLKTSKPPFTAVIADFGNSSRIESSTGQMPPFLMGTLKYCPPESLEQQIGGRKGDSWSLGLVMAELLLGFLPFLFGVHKRDINAVVRQNVPTFVWDTSDAKYRYIPSSAHDVLMKLIKKDFVSRINLHDALQRPWFSEASKTLIFSAATLNVYPVNRAEIPKQIKPEPEADLEATSERLARTNLNEGTKTQSSHHSRQKKAGAQETSRKAGTTAKR